GCRNHCRPLAQKNSKPEIPPFCPLYVLGFSEAAMDRERRAGDENRIRGVRPGGTGMADQVGKKCERVVHEHGSWGTFPGKAARCRSHRGCSSGAKGRSCGCET